MEPTTILLIFAGVAGLMVLYKILYRQPAPSNPISPPDITQLAAAAGQRMGKIAKPAMLFAEASMLLVREVGFTNNAARVGTALFFAGATDFLAQKEGLNDIEFMSVLAAVLEKAEVMSEQMADEFTDDLPALSETSFGRTAMILGGKTISSWLGGEDDVAPARLAQFVKEWASMSNE